MLARPSQPGTSPERAIRLGERTLPGPKQKKSLAQVMSSSAAGRSILFTMLKMTTRGDEVGQEPPRSPHVAIEGEPGQRPDERLAGLIARH